MGFNLYELNAKYVASLPNNFEYNFELHISHSIST